MWKIKFESGAEMKIKANNYFAAQARGKAIIASTKRRQARIFSIVKIDA